MLLVGTLFLGGDSAEDCWVLFKPSKSPNLPVKYRNMNGMTCSLCRVNLNLQRQRSIYHGTGKKRKRVTLGSEGSERVSPSIGVGLD